MFIQNRFFCLAAWGRLALLASVGLLVLARPGLAGHGPGDVTGTPDIYNVTVNEFSLCADLNCTSKTTIISSSSVFDLAGATPNTSAGDYVPAGTTIPSGTYSYFLISIGQTIEVVGRISTVTHTPGDRDCITANTVAGGVMADNLTMEGTGAGTPGTTTFTIPAPRDGPLGDGVSVTTADGAMTLIIELAAPITISGGEVMPTFEINFDVTNRIAGFQRNAADCAIYLNAPTITVEVGGVPLTSIVFETAI